jgi:hypothetical protein
VGRKTPSTDKHQRRTYVVDQQRFRDFDGAAGRAIALAVRRREVVCIETVVGEDIVERIDVNAALSID